MAGNQGLPKGAILIDKFLLPALTRSERVILREEGREGRKKMRKRRRALFSKV